MTRGDIIRMLDLQPHLEGGWYRETLRIAAKDGARSPSFDCAEFMMASPGR